MHKYLQSCATDFWQNIFAMELGYILRELKGATDILSVGCGPAIIEAGLAKHGFNITGLDISKIALNQAPDSIRTVVGSAEDMSFEDCSFDAVIYIASLQFVENYERAIERTAAILRPDGKLLAMLLNPQSEFFRSRIMKVDSYLSRIKHPCLTKIEQTIAKCFLVSSEYFLGIKDLDIFDSQSPDLSALYVIKGKKRDSPKEVI